jgi:hypothetical protein
MAYTLAGKRTPEAGEDQEHLKKGRLGGVRTRGAFARGVVGQVGRSHSKKAWDARLGNVDIFKAMRKFEF